jgi:hypothetical protein
LLQTLIINHRFLKKPLKESVGVIGNVTPLILKNQPADCRCRR